MFKKHCNFYICRIYGIQFFPQCTKTVHTVYCYVQCAVAIKSRNKSLELCHMHDCSINIAVT